MKRLRFVLLAALIAAACGANVYAQDTLSVHNSVKEYFDSIVLEPVDSICAKVDALVETLADRGPKTQSAVAGLAFDYFNSSPIMGVEGVSVYVADNYFLNGRFEWPDKDSYSRLVGFADFNRSSLLGCSAPELEMEDINGLKVSLREESAAYKIIFFYEPGCPTCLQMSNDLCSILSKYSGVPIAFFAINTGSDKETWQQYVADHFDIIDNRAVSVYNMWDPEVSTSYHKKYGLMITPALLLTDSQNIIVGRKLDVKALRQLIGLGNKDSEDFRELFTNIFDGLYPVSPEDVMTVADTFRDKVGQDTSLFRDVYYNLFEYLRSSGQYALQLGAIDLAEKYIIGEPWMWSPEYVDNTLKMLLKAERNPLESRAPDLLLYDSKGRFHNLLQNSADYTLVLFHLVSCKDCEKMIEELKGLVKPLRRAGVKVKLVYTGNDEVLWKNFIASSPKNWTYLWDRIGDSGMMKKYDLEFVPHMYLLDEHKFIIGKDFDVRTLEELLPLL